MTSSACTTVPWAPLPLHLSLCSTLRFAHTFKKTWQLEKNHASSLTFLWYLALKCIAFFLTFEHITVIAVGWIKKQKQKNNNNQKN